VSGTNLIRILALSTGGAIIGQIAIVIYVYGLAWKRSPHRRGIVPRYVVGVSVFTVLAEVVFMTLIVDLFRDDAPLTFYGPMILAANIDLMISLALVFRYDRRRVSAADPPFDPAEVPVRRAEDVAPLTSRWWGRIVDRSHRST
jgi:hypothetical protein